LFALDEKPAELAQRVGTRQANWVSEQFKTHGTG